MKVVIKISHWSDILTSPIRQMPEEWTGIAPEHVSRIAMEVCAACRTLPLPIQPNEAELAKKLSDLGSQKDRHVFLAFTSVVRRLEKKVMQYIYDITKRAHPGMQSTGMELSFETCSLAEMNEMILQYAQEINAKRSEELVAQGIPALVPGTDVRTEAEPRIWAQLKSVDGIRNLYNYHCVEFQDEHHLAQMVDILVQHDHLTLFKQFLQSNALSIEQCQKLCTDLRALAAKMEQNYEWVSGIEKLPSPARQVLSVLEKFLVKTLTSTMPFGVQALVNREAMTQLNVTRQEVALL